jgi:diguanylate cyclase (GGDEF)-like protein
MVDAATGNYIFGVSEDRVGTQIESKEILDICQKYNNTKQEITDNFTYRKDGKEYISIYTYIPGYNWVLMIDDDTNEAFALTRTMIIYLGIFGLVIISLIVVFNIIAKRQEKVNQKLYSTIAKNNMTKKSLNTAMFNDVLTGVNNRISFSINVEKMNAKSTDYRYFIMFNIIGFSEINTNYGNDAGDNVLVRTVGILKEFFPDREIYRTGSDEFVLVVPAEKEFSEAKDVLNKINIAYRVLTTPADFDNGTKIYSKFKIAMVRKGKNADSSVIAVLKDMTNRTGEAIYGQIDYMDLG